MGIKIFLDNIVFSLQKAGGISVVWENLIVSLLKNENLNIQFIEYYGSKKNIHRKNLSIPEDQIIHSKSVPLKLVRFLTQRISSREKFIFHSSDYRFCSNRNAINVVTVHDLLYFISNSNNFYQKIVIWIHRFQMKRSLANAHAIVCISENTKSDLHKYLPFTIDKHIKVVHNGVSDDFFPLNHHSNNYKLPFSEYEYVIFIGRRSRYKNFNLTVTAVAKTNYNLLIIGPQLNKSEKRFIEDKLSSERYKCLSHVGNHDLNIFYNYAFALLYLSSYEGFGIPVIEAQRAGCPVIAYNSSSIPEIIGSDFLLVNSLNEDEIVHKISLLTIKEIRDDVIKKGLYNSSKFDWKNSTSKLAKLYEYLIHINS